jgi:hypothetical protein
MSGMLRGALVEYGSNFLGPLPNVVVFQFNPEQLARTITIPQRSGTASAGSRTSERRQAEAPPLESFTVTAHFSAADDLGKGGAAAAIPRVFGIGPQIAALEKMVYPSNIAGGLLGEAIDAIGDALGGGDDEAPERPVPREQLPRILLIWGLTRILPVTINSMTITEQRYDFLLNPVQAQVEIGLEVINDFSSGSDDIGEGALAYTQTVKEAQASLNLVKAVELVVDIIPF